MLYIKKFCRNIFLFFIVQIYLLDPCPDLIELYVPIQGLYDPDPGA